MPGIFQGRIPYAPFKYFEEISAIPRGSGNEEGIARYLEAFAEERGLDVYVDQTWNVLIKKPGSQGCQGLAPLLLQGHTDIVCEKNKDTDHDFERDGIKLVVEGDILKAAGTTLGSDDGYAVAYMLAVLDSDIQHPPLECLFTSMEEIGLIGAQLFDAGRIASRRMIGMDSGDEGVCQVSSAGGIQVEIKLPAKAHACASDGISLAVRGLMGGHSGGCIDKERGNANQILGRVLYRISKEVDFRLSRIGGGMKDNAIPREADCVIALEPADVDRAIAIATAVAQEVTSEFRFSDPGFRLEIERTKVKSSLDAACTEKALAVQHLIPDGVDAMSMAVSGLVDASQNFAVVTQNCDEIIYTVSIRSSQLSMRDALADRMLHFAAVLGLEAKTSSPYPPYPYQEKSALRGQLADFYRLKTGKELGYLASHGGTECGVLTDKLPGLDIVTIAPSTGDVHTPDEWMDLASFGRVYQFLVDFLGHLCMSDN